MCLTYFVSCGFNDSSDREVDRSKFVEINLTREVILVRLNDSLMSRFRFCFNLWYLSTKDPVTVGSWYCLVAGGRRSDPRIVLLGLLDFELTKCRTS